MKLENKIVREISVCGGLSRSELEKRVGASASSVSRTTVGLSGLGLVEQTGKGEDKRFILGKGVRLVSAFLEDGGFCLSTCLFDGSGREDREFGFCEEMFPEDNISAAIGEMGMYVRSLALRGALVFGAVLPMEFHGSLLSVGADAAFEMLGLAARSNSACGGLGMYAVIEKNKTKIFLLFEGRLINSPNESTILTDDIETLAHTLGANELFVDSKIQECALAKEKNCVCRVLVGNEGKRDMMLEVLRDIAVDKLLGRYKNRK